MLTEEQWQERATALLKAELVKRRIGYKGLAYKLGELGIEDNFRNIGNKMSRGGFSAAFLLQCLTAIGCHTLHLDGEGFP
jgi:hypothetical protein